MLGGGKDAEYLEVRVGTGEEDPNPQRPKTLPFRCVSSLFRDIFELLLQELHAVPCLHLEPEGKSGAFIQNY